MAFYLELFLERFAVLFLKISFGAVPPVLVPGTCFSVNGRPRGHSEHLVVCICHLRSFLIYGFWRWTHLPYFGRLFVLALSPYAYSLPILLH